MTTHEIKLPLEKILIKAMIKKGLNAAQAMSRITNVHDKYDNKYMNDIEIIFDVNMFKAYVLERSNFIYRYFNLYDKELRQYIKTKESKTYDGKENKLLSQEEVNKAGLNYNEYILKIGMFKNLKDEK